MKDESYRLKNQKGSMDADFYMDTKIRTGTFEMTEAHWHSYHELYYLYSGERKFFIKDKMYHVRRGDIVLVVGGDLHRTTFIAPQTHERFVINFRESIRRECFSGQKEAAIFFQSRHIRLEEHMIQEFEQLVTRLLGEYQNGEQLYAGMMSRLLLQELLIFLMRHTARTQAAGEVQPGQLPAGDDEIQRAAGYIYENYHRSLYLAEVAAVAGMSEHYFSKKFKKVTGFRFREYLTAVRISKSMEMMTTTDLPITDIGIRCGFSDGNYFGDVFKKSQGISPLQFRKMWKQ